MADSKSVTVAGRAQLYNVITAVMLALTVVSCCLFALLAVTSAGNQVVSAEPTLFVIPTFTSEPAGPTPGPTWTAAPSPTPTRTPTITVTPSITPEPSITPTITDTPTATLTNTPTPTITPTFTLTPTPTNTLTPTSTFTPSPFDYVLRDGTITYTSNFANSAGCNWLGIAGVIFNSAGQHQTGVTVHLTGGGLDVTRISGSTPAYGASGWEVYLDDHPKLGTFFVRLETAGGDPLSDTITVQSGTTCETNLALVVFDANP